MFHAGEVWFAGFPLEENPNEIINRPVVVLDETTLGVLSVKITKHAPRAGDRFDIPIIKWSEAGLHLASTARVSKILLLQPEDFIFKIGQLDDEDFSLIAQTYIDFMTSRN